MKRNNKIPTIMDSVEPFSEEEQKEFIKKWRKEWFEKSVDGIIDLASLDNTYAEVLVEKCAIYDGLRKYLLKELKKKGKGKKRGESGKWTIDRLKSLLIHYHVFYDNGREFALTRLSELEGVSPEHIAGLITRARREVPIELLPPWTQSIHKPQKRKSRIKK